MHQRNQHNTQNPGSARGEEGETLPDASTGKASLATALVIKKMGQINKWDHLKLKGYIMGLTHVDV